MVGTYGPANFSIQPTRWRARLILGVGTSTKRMRGAHRERL